MFVQESGQPFCRRSATATVYIHEFRGQIHGIIDIVKLILNNIDIALHEWFEIEITMNIYKVCLRFTDFN